MRSNVYKQTTLGEIALFTNGGAWSQTEYCDKGVPVVRVTDIKDETVNLFGCKFLPQSALAKYDKHLLQEGDLVICTVGSHPTQPGSVVGRAAIMPEAADGALLNQNAVRIRSSLPNVDQCWLGYLGRSEKFHDYIISCARGSANQVRMAIGLLKEMPIEVPPFPVQRRIAGILSAYDELIENNQRRIKILEEMARSLYREWFIHFRFPTGNEPSPDATRHPLPLGEGRSEDRVKLVASPLGPIPQGWEVKKLADLTVFLSRGISPYYGDEGDSIVVNQKCIRDQRLSLEPARRQTKPIPTDKCVRFGDVLINSTGVGTLGRVAQVYEDMEQCTVDSHVTIVRRNSDTDVDFFGCALLLKQEIFERLGIGATGQTELSRTAIGEIEIPVPPDSLQKRFGALTHPMRTAANTLSKQTENLRRTRDLLLPRLLSGQVDLSKVSA